MRSRASSIVIVAFLVDVAGCAAGPSARDCNSDAACAADERCVDGACTLVEAPPVSDLAGVPIHVATDEESATSFALASTGAVKGEPVAFALLLPPRHGDVAQQRDDDTSTIVFTPDDGYVGADFAQYAPVQAGVLGRPAAITIDVAHVDHAPRLTVTGPFPESGGASFYASATDRDDDVVTYAATFTHGTAAVHATSDGNADIEYDAGSFHGVDTGTITATDAGGAVSSTPISVTVP